ncbi:sex peptide receptor-like [Planococcus citri]|uniref:sex peptide receptor-like n=1 Tax=Planococcus citri TaxID=170843 RepID=UPI0031F90D80
MSSEDERFCAAALANFQWYYAKNMLGLIDIPICIIGVIFNIFNMLVFTRRNMKSPVNLIFTYLSFANLLQLLAFITVTWAYLAYLSEPPTYEDWTYTRASFSMLSEELLNISKRISVYITMMLAIWKYIAVFYPSKESQWCNMKTTRYTLVAGYIICILFVIPEYMSHYIKPETAETKNQTITTYKYEKIKTDSIMHSASQFIKIVLHELLPSLVLPILGVRLIATLWMKKEHPTPSSNVENRTDNAKTNQQTNRSIIISMIIVAQCLSYAIPLGLLRIAGRMAIKLDLSSADITNYLNCHYSIQVILSLLDCVNKSINFIVYYTMDQDFRATFKSLFNKNNASFWKLKYVRSSSTRGNDESLEIDRCDI